MFNTYKLKKRKTNEKITEGNTESFAVILLSNTSETLGWEFGMIKTRQGTLKY